MADDAPGRGWLVPWRVERILRDDEDFLIVDKPPGIVVHGGDDTRSDDLVTRLGLYLTGQGRDGYLGVHQRLDQGTSGVLFFTRRKDKNGEVARAMEQHQISRSYRAVVTLSAQSRLKARGRIEHQLRHDRGRTEIVARGGQRAVTDYEVLDRVGARALVGLKPLTGRTHQLRAQLAALGAPICGDRLYGGEPAPRLFLHAAELGGDALGGTWSSPVPRIFRDWLGKKRSHVPASPFEDTHGLLADAGLHRFALRGQTSAYRLVNGVGDLLPGVVVDVYEKFAVLSLYDADLVAQANALAEHMVRMGFSGVYLKIRVRADLRRQELQELAPEAPVAGDAAGGELVVTEHGLRFQVTLGSGLSTGLFVDQRDNRCRVRQRARGARVLNLFSYTCSFSVAAAAGGAREVVSIDLSRRALERGRRNFELNGIDPARHRFFKEDAIEWLGRASRRGDRFDLVVLDPPSFSTVGKGTFSVERRYGEVAARCFGLLEPGGALLAVTNHSKTSQAELRKILHQAAATAGRRIARLRDAPSGIDCPEGPEGPWPSKSAWATLDGS